MVEMILRMIGKNKQVKKISMIEDNGKAEEVGQKWSILSVASMTTMQMNADPENVIIVVRSAIAK